MSNEDINNANFEQPEKKEMAHFVWQNFAVTNNTDARKAAPKMQCACFVTKASGCSTSRAAAHILGHLVLDQ